MKPLLTVQSYCIYAQAAGSEKYIKINAKSVILATGDYLANEEMMKFYAPQCVENGIQILSLDMDADGNYTNVGDGHKMGDLGWRRRRAVACADDSPHGRRRRR